jgi:hypothetical protein
MLRRFEITQPTNDCDIRPATFPIGRNDRGFRTTLTHATPKTRIAKGSGNILA